MRFSSALITVAPSPSPASPTPPSPSSPWREVVRVYDAFITVLTFFPEVGRYEIVLTVRSRFKVTQRNTKTNKQTLTESLKHTNTHTQTKNTITYISLLKF